MFAPELKSGAVISVLEIGPAGFRYRKRRVTGRRRHGTVEACILAEENDERPAAARRRRYRRRRGPVFHLARFPAHRRHGHARGDDRLRDLWPARAPQWTKW